jgi:hypothetical protein
MTARMVQWLVEINYPIAECSESDLIKDTNRMQNLILLMV